LVGKELGTTLFYLAELGNRKVGKDVKTAFLQEKIYFQIFKVPKRVK